MTKNLLARVVRGDATKEQAKDTGMALVLVLFLVWFSRRQNAYLTAAFIVHVVNMIAPQVFRPLAVLWFGLSHVMGIFASKMILTIIFFGIVTPIGLCRRIAGSDALKLRAFKAGKQSVMRVRNHTFIGKDLEQPY